MAALLSAVIQPEFGPTAYRHEYTGSAKFLTGDTPMWQDAKSNTGFGSSGYIGKMKWVMVISLHSSLKRKTKEIYEEHLGAVCALVFPYYIF